MLCWSDTNFSVLFTANCSVYIVRSKLKSYLFSQLQRNKKDYKGSKAIYSNIFFFVLCLRGKNDRLSFQSLLLVIILKLPLFLVTSWHLVLIINEPANVLEATPVSNSAEKKVYIEKLVSGLCAHNHLNKIRNKIDQLLGMWKGREKNVGLWWILSQHSYAVNVLVHE